MLGLTTGQVEVTAPGGIPAVVGTNITVSIGVANAANKYAFKSLIPSRFSPFSSRNWSAQASMVVAMRRRDSRLPDGGSITILAAAFLIVLFSLAALAIDAGFLFTRSRMIYAVADSAVTAGMGDLVAGDQNAAKADVDNLAANYTGYTFARSTTASKLTVQVSATYPLFFGNIVGIHSKKVTATAVGQITNLAPALLSLGNCGSGASGLHINGGGNLRIHGNVESNGVLGFSANNLTTVSGFAESPCAGSPSLGGSPPTIAGGSGPGGPFPDPFLGAAGAFPPCDYGNLFAASDPPAGNWSAGGVLKKGVYCSGGAMNVSSPDACKCMIANGVSFIALGDLVLGDDGTSSLSAAAGMPDNIVAYSAAATDCSAGEAINVGFNTFNIQGSMYAPNGCINVGDNGGLTVNGSLIAKSLQIGANGTWDLGPTGGAGGGVTWQMLQ